MSSNELITVGHGTSTAGGFAELVRSADVQAVVDIRTAPGSRRHPHFNRDRLEQWLPREGIAYRWEPRLGGFRRLLRDTGGSSPSPDTALRHPSFRAYAAHMRTSEFREAVTELLEEAARRRTAVMCSESVWWRCHRRLIADHVMLLWDRDVLHLMPDGRLAPHRPTSGVRVGEAPPRSLIYDVGSIENAR